ncbi:SDR family NAD(P)-dependent oxidoreductase [Xanthobacter agilis]|uniref:Short-subunit dehydrogenase n=1 Tax=Xanthobacter agilis TaxID=47492 RepID=A0ABU0LBP1_XANAG|nr:SDR family NAD(P)-dependent oxidoreductase [Xanthobacter agilis]MDQ0504512.1 short-subunit dehydrogenase [Xanthobacter agilis]
MTSRPAGRPAARPSHVAVTGASGGLGAAFARHYAAPGVRLLLIARDARRLDAIAADCAARGADVATLSCDVRNAHDLRAALLAHDAAHPVDLVVANAGVEASVGPDGAPEPLDTVLAQIETNLSGALASVVPLLPAMQARRHGAVILVSSLAALEPLADQPAYCASKAGLLAWGEAARPWLRRFGIQVTVACPGFIATGMSSHYEGWRPLEWSAEKAARHIAEAAARGRGRVDFPWPLVALIGLGKLAPRPLREAVRDLLFRLSVH